MRKFKAIWKAISEAWNVYGLLSALGGGTLISGFSIAFIEGIRNAPILAQLLMSIAMICATLVAVNFFWPLRRLPSLFYDEHDPNCNQQRGQVFPQTGAEKIEYDETIYRVGILSKKQIRGCRVVLAHVEPEPNDPGRQRIGLAMRPRIPVTTGSEEFTVNQDAPAFVELLQEVVKKVNTPHEMSTIKLIYVNEDRGRANWFENGDYVLTFRLEGPFPPVNYKLAVKFDGRRQYRRWRVVSA